MKLSLNWIKEYVELPAGLGMEKLMYDLTMSTVEVEGAENLAGRFRNIIVGEIKEVLPHPNADKLRICRTDVGGEIKEIVCGGINLRDGMKVIVSKPGAFVRWHGEGDLVEIKAAKLRGAESYGMICASTEVGLFDLFPFEDEATIVDLSDFAAPAGTPLERALGLDDVILEIDNRSLTNRPDLWGHYGIAREISAIYNVPMKEIAKFEPEQNGEPRVAIDDPERCTRYIGIKIENVSAKPSSFEIQSFLWRVGQRPINALVDITNYVMLAVGQPTHAFDSGNISGGITVRGARAEEKLPLLNGRELSLTSEDLVIADDDEAVALAGVMGGSKDSILPDTKNVILEIANFAPLGVRKTEARFEIRTEASIRYEKGIDPQRADLAVSLGCALFKSEFPGMRITGANDNYPRPLEQSRVTLSLDWLAKRLGKRLENDNIRAILERLGFVVTIEGDELRVTAPSWRSTGDISLPDDIMEEVARLYGYENFEPTPITTSFERAIKQRDYELDRSIREYLSFRCGMQEIFTYPWMKDEFISALGAPRAGMLQLATPPAPDERYIRNSLLPNLVRAVSENLRFGGNFSIYELTQVFDGSSFSKPLDERENLPHMARRLAGALAGTTGGADEITSLFRTAKGILENMSLRTHMEPLSLDAAEQSAAPWADETIKLAVRNGDGVIGYLALLSRKSALAAGIKQAPVVLFEIDVEKLAPLPSRANKFVHLPEYPQAEYDISMIFPEEAKWGGIEDVITGGKNALVKSASFIDEYRGRQIPEGKKSVTIRLIIGSDEKTLTSEEIESAAEAIIKRLTKRLGGELRG
ncbi:phenylalanine--tRNA ligase beta subunit [Synergistales bacterium]|nr:phenylalanine--tRNA ligase beta subunit [Synergistales bacterium]